MLENKQQPITRNYMKKLFLATIVAFCTGPVSGVVINNPLSLSTEFLVGIHNGQGANANLDTELALAQAILDLSLGEVDGNFEANTVFDYSGTITSNSGQLETGINGDATISVPAGWGGALVKYDGPNAGYVLYAFGGTASTIPEYPWNIWTTNEEQYQASHYVLLRGSGDLTPNPTTTVPEGGVGVALLGLCLAGMGLVRKIA